LSERNYEYEKQKTDLESRAYLRGLLEGTSRSIDALSSLESDARAGKQTEFKQAVNKLTKYYYYKFDDSDVERPEIIENAELDGPANITNKPVSEVKKVFFRIMQLQQELEHTKIEGLDRGNRVI